MNCSAPTHLAGLFGAINKEDTALDDLSLTLNMTSYMLWQIVTTFVQNDDTGWVSGPSVCHSQHRVALYYA
jgi:hypothetical protein